MAALPRCPSPDPLPRQREGEGAERTCGTRALGLGSTGFAQGIHGAAVEDVLSALTNLGYQRLATEKAVQHAVEKDAALASEFDGLFRAALKVIR